jgi:hypothetical protein
VVGLMKLCDVVMKQKRNTWQASLHHQTGLRQPGTQRNISINNRWL